LERQVVRSVGVPGHVDRGVIRAQGSGAEGEISEDFIAELDAAIVSNEGAEIGGGTRRSRQWRKPARPPGL
jgi:hypothetical protein